MLQSGAHCSDLQKKFLKKYPSMTYVVISTLKDNSLTSPDTALNDGDEVAFLAPPAGG